MPLEAVKPQAVHAAAAAPTSLPSSDGPAPVSTRVPRSASQQLAWQRLWSLLLAPVDAVVAESATTPEVA
jgi:hypothetical protein